jgi:hypothetical protein
VSEDVRGGKRLSPVGGVSQPQGLMFMCSSSRGRQEIDVLLVPPVGGLCRNKLRLLLCVISRLK